MIPWRPITELPDELKDGREVLISDGRAVVIAQQLDGDGEWLVSAEGRLVNGNTDLETVLDVSFTPTHFAEITPP